MTIASFWCTLSPFILLTWFVWSGHSNLQRKIPLLTTKGELHVTIGRMSHSEAEEVCKEINGILPPLNDRIFIEEMKQLTANFKRHSDKDQCETYPFWIGLRKNANDSKLYWSDGKEFTVDGDEKALFNDCHDNDGMVNAQQVKRQGCYNFYKKGYFFCMTQCSDTDEAVTICLLPKREFPTTNCSISPVKVLFNPVILGLLAGAIPLALLIGCLIGRSKATVTATVRGNDVKTVSENPAVVEPAYAHMGPLLVGTKTSVDVSGHIDESESIYQNFDATTGVYSDLVEPTKEGKN